jgi:hypothetical protein
VGQLAAEVGKKRQLLHAPAIFGLNSDVAGQGREFLGDESEGTLVLFREFGLIGENQGENAKILFAAEDGKVQGLSLALGLTGDQSLARGGVGDFLAAGAKELGAAGIDRLRKIATTGVEQQQGNTVYRKTALQELKNILKGLGLVMNRAMGNADNLVKKFKAIALHEPFSLGRVIIS